MFNRRSPTQAEVISAAVSDARAQDEMQALASEAALFICEVVSKAQAFNEELPRGYCVTSKGTALVLKCSVLKALLPLNYTGPAGVEIATVEDGAVHFIDADSFISDVNNGLIPEIGRYLIKRAKRNRGRVQPMRGAVDDVRTYRALLNDETW